MHSSFQKDNAAPLNIKQTHTFFRCSGVDVKTEGLTQSFKRIVCPVRSKSSVVKWLLQSTVVLLGWKSLRLMAIVQSFLLTGSLGNLWWIYACIHYGWMSSQTGNCVLFPGKFARKAFYELILKYWCSSRMLKQHFWKVHKPKWPLTCERLYHDTYLCHSSGWSTQMLHMFVAFVFLFYLPTLSSKQAP